MIQRKALRFPVIAVHSLKWNAADAKAAIGFSCVIEITCDQFAQSREETSFSLISGVVGADHGWIEGAQRCTSLPVRGALDCKRREPTKPGQNLKKGTRLFQ
jgi:hypothetical protein